MSKVRKWLGKNKDVPIGEIVAKLLTDSVFLGGTWKQFVAELGIDPPNIHRAYMTIDQRGDFATAFWNILDVYVSRYGSDASICKILAALEKHKLIKLKEQIQKLGNGKVVSEQYKPFIETNKHLSENIDGDLSLNLGSLSTGDNNSDFNPEDTIVISNVPELGKDEDIAVDLLHTHHNIKEVNVLKAKRIGKRVIGNPFSKKSAKPRPLAISISAKQHTKKAMQCAIDALNSSSYTKSYGMKATKWFGQVVNKSKAITIPHTPVKHPSPDGGQAFTWTESEVRAISISGSQPYMAQHPRQPLTNAVHCMINNGQWKTSGQMRTWEGPVPVPQHFQSTDSYHYNDPTNSNSLAQYAHSMNACGQPNCGTNTAMLGMQQFNSGTENKFPEFGNRPQQAIPAPGQENCRTMPNNNDWNENAMYYSRQAIPAYQTNNPPRMDNVAYQHSQAHTSNYYLQPQAFQNTSHCYVGIPGDLGQNSAQNVWAFRTPRHPYQ